jgi:hypothetical protein
LSRRAYPGSLIPGGRDQFVAVCGALSIRRELVVPQVLAIDRSSSLAQRTIDITTTGRRSGEPRRIETVFSRHPTTSTSVEYRDLARVLGC